MGVKLNIGGGQKAIEGYETWDIKDGHPAFPLPHGDGEVDAIYASHVIEHIDMNDVPKCLKEWRRVLAPGGTLHIGTVDLDIAYQAISDPNAIGGFPQRWIVGGQTDQHDRHGSIFNAQLLTDELHTAGFMCVEPFDSFVDDCTRLPVSLNLKCIKPAPENEADFKHKMVFCITMGYLTFSPWVQALVKAVGRFTGTPYVWCNSGPFWDRDMSHLMEAVLANNPRYIVTMDHDSTFEADDVAEMIRLMDAHPEIDALYPVQMSRHNDKPLCYDPKYDYTDPITVKPYGHFGLTVLRSRIFRRLPQPWFFSLPGHDGKWMSPLQSDGDITFWRMLRKNGMVAAQANRVCIGHMVLLNKYPTSTGFGFQTIPDFVANGRPPWVEFVGGAFGGQPKGVQSGGQSGGVESPSNSPQPTKT